MRRSSPRRSTATIDGYLPKRSKPGGDANLFSCLIICYAHFEADIALIPFALIVYTDCSVSLISSSCLQPPRCTRLCTRSFLMSIILTLKLPKNLLKYMRSRYFRNLYRCPDGILILTRRARYSPIRRRQISGGTPDCARTRSKIGCL